MEMKAKVTLGVAILAVAIVGYVVFMSVSEKRNQAEALAAADTFVRHLYGPPGDISRAYEMVSEGFRAVQSKTAVSQMIDQGALILGNYLSHQGGTDVTRAIAPDAPPQVKILKFDVAYQNDREGRIIVTTVKERGKWRVLGFNISSPTIEKAQLTQSLGPPAGLGAESGLRTIGDETEQV